MLGTTALQMLAGGIFLGALGLVRGELAHLAFNTRTTIALVYLATVGAIGGFVAYTYALRHLPVSFVSLYAYINPIIAVALGVLLARRAVQRAHRRRGGAGAGGRGDRAVEAGRRATPQDSVGRTRCRIPVQPLLSGSLPSSRIVPRAERERHRAFDDDLAVDARDAAQLTHAAAQARTVASISTTSPGCTGRR